MALSRILACLPAIAVLSVCVVAGEPAAPGPPSADPAVSEPGTAPAGEAGGTILSGTVYEVLEKGRIMMVPIIAASVIGLAIALERLFGLRRGRIAPRKLYPEVEAALKSEGVAAAIASCESRPSPLGRVLKAGLDCFRVLAPAGVGVADIESSMNEAMGDIAAQELWRLRAPTRRLGFIANVSPLMGLLGTVMGMIRLFDVIGRKGAVGNVQELAGGIAEALITTAAGLIVAIPFLFLYEHFRSKAERNIHIVAELGTRLTRAVVAHTTTQARRPEQTAPETLSATAS